MLRTLWPLPVPAACLLALSLSPASAWAISLPIIPDGDFTEWSPAALVATDPAGDDGSSGIDFTFLSLANDQDRLYLHFDTTTEVQPDEGQDIVLALDTDANPATGQSVNGIGAELVWNLGQRSGTFYSGGSSTPVDHADIGLLIAPTVSDFRFELAVRRDATISGTPLFSGSPILVSLEDTGSSGDAMVLGGPGYSFDSATQPTASLGFDRLATDHTRIAVWNVKNDGLFAGGAEEAAQNRIADAIVPDVWVFCEVWNHDAAEVATQVETLLPSGSGEAWYAVKRDAGNVICSRYPILDSWEIYPGNRLTAALLDLGPAASTDLLVIANHWSCCTADASRQRQADALIAFLRDARTTGGVIDLPTDTPIVAAGDFNLVGWRAQLITLLTGDISDNGTWGADSPPDWDGSDFAVATARHQDARVNYTWRSDTSSFYPGRLDWMLYTGSALSLRHHYVLDTRTMTTGTRAAKGLLASDTETASDHAPVVADYTVGSSTAVAGRESGLPGLLLPATPNPFRAGTRVRFTLDTPSAVTLQIFDVTGREVRRLLDRRPLGVGGHELIWNGTDQGSRRLPPGVYFLRLAAEGRVEGTKLHLLR